MDILQPHALPAKLCIAIWICFVLLLLGNFKWQITEQKYTFEITPKLTIRAKAVHMAQIAKVPSQKNEVLNFQYWLRTKPSSSKCDSNYIFNLIVKMAPIPTNYLIMRTTPKPTN